MNKKIVSVISMALGISLSCITNLLTGDNEVISWFNANKSIVVVAGLILTFASLIIAYFAESEGEQSAHKTKIKASFFTNLITNFFSSLVLGAIITLMVIYGLGYFDLEQNNIHIIAVVLVGAGLGSELRYVGGNGVTGAIAGAFLAIAFTYYFPNNIQLPFLPDWVNQYPVIPNAFFAAILGMYTGIYSKPYLENAKRKREEDEQIGKKKSQQFYLLRERLEQAGYHLLSSNFIDDLKRKKLDLKAATDKYDPSGTENSLSSKPDALDMGFWQTWYKAISLTFRNESKTMKFKSPYYIYDDKGNNKYFSDDINEIIDFANQMLAN